MLQQWTLAQQKGLRCLPHMLRWLAFQRRTSGQLRCCLHTMTLSSDDCIMLLITASCLGQLPWADGLLNRLESFRLLLRGKQRQQTSPALEVAALVAELCGTRMLANVCCAACAAARVGTGGNAALCAAGFGAALGNAALLAELPVWGACFPRTDVRACCASCTAALLGTGGWLGAVF